MPVPEIQGIASPSSSMRSLLSRDAAATQRSIAIVCWLSHPALPASWHRWAETCTLPWSRCGIRSLLGSCWAQEGKKRPTFPAGGSRGGRSRRRFRSPAPQPACGCAVPGYRASWLRRRSATTPVDVRGAVPPSAAPLHPKVRLRLVRAAPRLVAWVQAITRFRAGAGARSAAAVAAAELRGCPGR